MSTRIELMLRLETALKRIEALENALREIADQPLLEGRSWLSMRQLARAALAPEKDKTDV